MRKNVILLIAVLLPTCAQLAHSQGSFENLNFESATVVLDPTSPYYPHAVIASNAIPGWTAYTYGNALTTILYDSQTLGNAAVALIDANDLGGASPLQGLYSLGLNGQDPGTGPNQAAAIAQTGQLPSTVESLRFYAQLGSLQITFNGQLIPYTAIGSGADYTIYGCDISAFAGQTGELRFTTLPNTSALIDNIQFSNLPVPEPSVFAVSALGALLVGRRVLRRR